MTINTEHRETINNREKWIDPFQFRFKYIDSDLNNYFDHNLEFALIRDFKNGFYSIFLNDTKRENKYKYSVYFDNDWLLKEHTFDKKVVFHRDKIKKPLEALKEVSIIVYTKNLEMIKTVKISVIHSPKNIDTRINMKNSHIRINFPYIYGFTINNQGVSKYPGYYNIDIYNKQYSNEKPIKDALNFFSFYKANNFVDPNKISSFIDIKSEEVKILETSYTDVNAFKIIKNESQNDTHDFRSTNIKKIGFSFLDSYKYDLAEKKIKPFDPVSGQKGILISPNYTGSLLFSQKVEFEWFGKFEIFWKQDFQKSKTYPNKNNYSIKIISSDTENDNWFEKRFFIHSDDWSRIIQKSTIDNDYLNNKFLYKKEEND